MGGRGDGSGGGGGGGSDAPGKYSPWTDDGKEILSPSSDVIPRDVVNWVNNSQLFRKGVRGESKLEQGRKTNNMGMYTKLGNVDARAFDNYLAEGEWTKGDLYRGVRMDSTALEALQPGMLVNQNGPASFTKKQNIAENFSDTPAFGGKKGQQAIFVLEGGTKAGRDIGTTTSWMPNPYEEVAVASCSHIRVTKVSKKNGITYIHGTEEIYQYDPNAIKGHGTQIV